MTDEHTVAIVSFEGAIKREVKRIRHKLKAAAELGLLPGNSFNFRVTASGRILDGEIKISFEISENEYWSNPVQGNSSENTVEEYLRRKGWAKINAPIAISFDKTTPAPIAGDPPEDEIPF